jgi:hypothetical protein
MQQKLELAKLLEEKKRVEEERKKNIENVN